MRANPDSSKPPLVLLATAERWTSTARLALALRALGCEVVLLGPKDHPAGVCAAVSRSFRYDSLRPMQSLSRALREVEPTTILPADETIACQLGELWQGLQTRDSKEGDARKRTERETLQALLTRSLGDPDRLGETGSRIRLQRAAEAEGILTPATLEIAGADALPEAFARLGSPLVLKADASSGGRGVRVVASVGAAQRVYRAFSRAPHLPRAVLRGVLHRDWTHVRSAARRERYGVTAQQKIEGVERTATVFAHHGEVLAVESFEVVHTWKLRGPSSVLRRVQDARMEAAIRGLARRLKIHGFCGFDFMVDARSGEPLLLECNARPTQLAHLSMGPGHDLVAAYVRAIVGLDVKDRAAATGRELIALFPHELQRNAESAALREAFHDVPWESPELMERVLRGDASLRAALGKMQATLGSQPQSGHQSGSSLVAGSANA